MTSGQSDIIDIEATITAETEKAFRLDVGNGGQWVPKSMVENNGDGTFAMPEWFATDKELI